MLPGKSHASERLHLLLEANGIRQKLAKTDPGSAEDRLHMARSYCRLGEAELGINDLGKAREYAGRCAPYLSEFRLSSPSLLFLRDLGYCYKALGNVHSGLTADRSLSAEARRVEAVEAKDWYTKGAAVWREWDRRGAATAESEAERMRVEHLLQAGNREASSPAHY